MAYDVFISYRRKTGADDARLLQQALKARGYEVFFDYDSLRDGKFNEKIFEAIDEAPVFVLMLTEGALDRCANEEDWVRIEIERALSKKKHVVPVAPSTQRWEFPSTLPESLRSVKGEQISELNKASLFEKSVDQIVEDRFPETLRKKCRSADTIISTVTAASSVFVGREMELAKLHEMLVAGKFPVITGAGGMGKSELARQYASRYKTDYPGGLFQLDMETVTSWETAFVDKLFERPSVTGVVVHDALGLKKPRSVDGQPQAAGECEKQRDKDAVAIDPQAEDCQNDKQLNASDVVLALNQRASRDGCILLLLDNVESTSILLREQGLAKLSLHPSVRMLVTARTVDRAFRPGDKCAEFPLGDLSPDAAFDLLLADHHAESDVERAAAKEIAKTLGFRVLYLRAIPGLLDDNYSPYGGSYAALAKALNENLLGTVGEGLSENDDMMRTPCALWAMTRQKLAAMQPCGIAWIRLAQLSAYCSPDGFQKYILHHLWNDLVSSAEHTVQAFNQAIHVLQMHGVLNVQGERLSMHRLMRAAIASTVCEEWPDIEDAIGASLAKCPYISQNDWKAFSHSSHGIDMLRHIPDVMLNGKLIVSLLLGNQEYAAICPWSRLRSNEWTSLLVDEPQFADKCPWEQLGGRDWSVLLSAQPQFSDRSPWEVLDGSDWSRLLAAQPQFADKCPWEELGGRDWSALLSARPQFSDRCPWGTFHESDWATLLSAQPQFSDRCPWGTFRGSDWATLLSAQPHFADMCHWEKLDGSDWAILLSAQPHFSDRCPWEELDGSAWSRLLSARPHFADMCHWDKFDGSDWSRLLSTQLQFADRCSWEKLRGYDWRELIVAQPQFLDRCPLEKLDGYGWTKLLSAQPQYAGKCHWEELNGFNWRDLLASQPQFADKCPIEKLDGCAVMEILRAQPQLLDKCSWEKVNGDALVYLLPSLPQLRDRCDWSKLNRWNWVSLLSKQPQFASKCSWEKLDHHAWVKLLSVQPQLADRCSWEKLDHRDWVKLLSVQPQFADRCSWGKLDVGDWSDLLASQPQFSYRCPPDMVKRVQKRGCIITLLWLHFLSVPFGAVHLILFLIFRGFLGWPGTLITNALGVTSGFLWWFIMGVNSSLWGCGFFIITLRLIITFEKKMLEKRTSVGGKE